MKSLTRREQSFVLVLVIAVTALVARWDRIPWAKLFPPEPGIPLRYEVRDFETNALIPCKLTLLGVGSTATPALNLRTAGCDTETATCERNRLMSISGTGTVVLPKGTYDVYVTHGIEWNRTVVRNLQLAGPEGGEANVVLRHAVETTGWISADFHVHETGSWDSGLSYRDRLFQAVSDDLRLLVSTDHNSLTNLAPVVAQYHLEQYIATVVGEEITPPRNQIGHFTAFPLRGDPAHPEIGSIPTEQRTPTQMLAEAHRRSADAFVIAAHPRDAASYAYFTWGGYDDATGAARNPQFSFDFNGVEVLNGSYGSSVAELDATVRDWFSLLNHGRRVTAVSGSDSHELVRSTAGYPRNFIRLGESAPEHLDVHQAVESLRGLHSQLSTGPLVHVSVGAAGPGDVVPAQAGKVHVELRVEAANWIAVRNVTVFVNGIIQRTWRVPASNEPIRFKRAFDLDFPRDGYFVVEVEGMGNLAPSVGEADYQVRPYALTNPIFVDADGDGQWVAPERS